MIMANNKYLITNAPVTGQSLFLPHVSSNLDEFPCQYNDNIFQMGCLDAPDYLPGDVKYVGKFAGDSLTQVQVTIHLRSNYFKN